MNWKFRCKNFVKIFFLFTLTIISSHQETSEILKVATTCKSVRCNKGYYCLVKVHNCSWGENCVQKIAKCVTEKEYYEATASCVDFQCPDGHKCILRESLCTRPPCKVLKSCARNTAAENWFKKCKQLGCTSEYECFIRRPVDKCDNKSCKHIPDCMLSSENELNKHCRGWICPLKTECLAHIMGPCQSNDCQIFRTCRSTVPLKSRLKTLPDIEREWFYQEEEKWRKQTLLTTPMSILDKIPSYDKTKLFFKPINAISSIQDNNLEIHNRAHIPNSESEQLYKKSTLSPVWLKSLKSKTGMDVVNFWLKEAEKNQHNSEFHQWLESIREALGPKKYPIWLESIRSQTSHSKKFQEWLPIPIPNINDNIPNFYQSMNFDSKINDMEGEVFSEFSKSQFDDTFKIAEYGEQRDNYLPMKTGNVDTASLTKYTPFNNSVNSSEIEKNSLIPTFIIIQTSPDEIASSISGSRRFNHPILESAMSQLNSNQQYQASQPLVRNYMTPFPTYHFLPHDNQQIKATSPSIFNWMHLLNYPSNGQTAASQLSQNLIPPNYLQNFLLPLPDQRSMLYWYPGIGYVNVHPQYNNNDESSIENNDENNYSKSTRRRRINWREFFKNKNYLKDENENAKRHEKPKRKEFLRDDNIELDRDKNEEEEIQFVKKILQEILDYNFELKDDEIIYNEKKEQNLNEKENENSDNVLNNERKKKKKKVQKNEKRKEAESENNKEIEKEAKKKRVKQKQNKRIKGNYDNTEDVEETEINSDDILMETLFNMIKEQLSNNQENVTNVPLETLLEEVENNENNTELLREEFEKFLENSEKETNGS